MDESRIINEYEKGVTGPIIFFIATLLLFEPIYGIFIVFQTARAFSEVPFIGNIYLFCGIGYLLSIPFTCFCFYKMPRYAVKVAKIFLVFRLLFLTLSIIINFNYTLHDKNAFGPRTFQFYTMQEMVIQVLLIRVAYVLVFSIGWYIFLIKSKTVKENYSQLRRMEL